MALTRALALASLLAACVETGTIEVSILEPQDSDLLSRIQRLRATLSSPRCVSEARRDQDGLRLSLEAEARGGAATVFAEGFDADDNLIAVGSSGPLPIAAIDAEVAILMAEPMSITQAPENLDPPRADVGVAALGLGGVLAGGIDAEGNVSGQLELYSVYTHSFDQGGSLPTPVSAPAIVAGSSNLYYIMGGRNQDGDDIAESYVFDASIPPEGRYSVISAADELARSGAHAVPLGQQRFFYSGAPGLVLDGFRLSFIPIEGGEGLNGPAVPVPTESGSLAVVVGAGVEQIAAVIDANAAIYEVDAPVSAERTNHAGTLLPNGDAIFVGGTFAGDRLNSALIFRTASLTLEQASEFLETGRDHPAVAATGTHLVVAGGTDFAGEVVGDVEIFSAFDLTREATLPLLVPRTEASAIALGNGQVLIAGGRDADGAPIEILEIFTPGPPGTR